MKQLFRKCIICNLYTLKEKCNKCNIKTHNPHSAKFSPDDKYARYRIEDRYKEEST
ncbi:MAG: RNA-protein complex protein Nop10 [Thaumarchaeota archaeon]|nr:RNA-protein complex protein Nop10 [Nitrososphaerota archaeon]